MNMKKKQRVKVDEVCYMKSHDHCYVLINSEIKKKKMENNEEFLDIIDTYYCPVCGHVIEAGCLSYLSFSESETYLEELHDCYLDVCMGDRDLICAVYSKISDNYPNISSEDIRVYICAALHNIENKKVSEERQKKRILRLGLKSDFNNWSKNSIVHCVD